MAMAGSFLLVCMSVLTEIMWLNSGQVEPSSGLMTRALTPLLLIQSLELRLYISLDSLASAQMSPTGPFIFCPYGKPFIPVTPPWRPSQAVFECTVHVCVGTSVWLPLILFQCSWPMEW